MRQNVAQSCLLRLSNRKHDCTVLQPPAGPFLCPRRGGRAEPGERRPSGAVPAHAKSGSGHQPTAGAPRLCYIACRRYINGLSRVCIDLCCCTIYGGLYGLFRQLSKAGAGVDPSKVRHCRARVFAGGSTSEGLFYFFVLHFRDAGL